MSVRATRTRTRRFVFAVRHLDDSQVLAYIPSPLVWEFHHKAGGNCGTLRSKVNELYCAKCPESGCHTSGFEGPVGLNLGFGKGGARDERYRTQELTMRRRPEPFRALIVALGLNPLQAFVGPLLPERPCGSTKQAGARSPVASRWVAVRKRRPKLEPGMLRVYSKNTSAAQYWLRAEIDDSCLLFRLDMMKQQTQKAGVAPVQEYRSIRGASTSCLLSRQLVPYANG